MAGQMVPDGHDAPWIEGLGIEVDPRPSAVRRFRQPHQVLADGIHGIPARPLLACGETAAGHQPGHGLGRDTRVGMPGGWWCGRAEKTRTEERREGQRCDSACSARVRTYNLQYKRNVLLLGSDVKH